MRIIPLATRCLVVATVAVTCSTSVAVAHPAMGSTEASSNAAGGRTDCSCSAPSGIVADGSVLDGFVLDWLPRGLGPLVSDFAYEWDDVRFASRVWESGSDDAGYHVDLLVTVLRGDQLTDAAAMRDFLAEYHEQDSASWARQSFDHDGASGFRTDSAVFWLAEPGVAVWISLDRGRFTDDTLVHTACGITSVDDSSP